MNDNKQIVLERIVKSDDCQTKEVEYLLNQLSSGEVSFETEDLDECLKNPNFYLFVLRDTSRGKIIGLGSIFFQRNLVRYLAEIHDVVVDDDYRGQGLGFKIICQLVDTAHNFAREKETGQMKLYLTSSSKREAANKIYQKLGFVRRAQPGDNPNGTNLYMMVIEG